MERLVRLIGWRDESGSLIEKGSMLYRPWPEVGEVFKVKPRKTYSGAGFNWETVEEGPEGTEIFRDSELEFTPVLDKTLEDFL